MSLRDTAEACIEWDHDEGVCVRETVANIEAAILAERQRILAIIEPGNWRQFGCTHEESIPHLIALINEEGQCPKS